MVTFQQMAEKMAKLPSWGLAVMHAIILVFLVAAVIVDVISYFTYHYLLLFTVIWGLIGVVLLGIGQLFACLSIYPLHNIKGYREYLKEISLAVVSTIVYFAYVVTIKCIFLYSWLNAKPGVTNYLFVVFDPLDAHDADYRRFYGGMFVTVILSTLITMSFVLRALFAAFYYKKSTQVHTE